jgi:hypothetical protein
MAPPWVIFDNVAWYDGDCANGSEPDIAGTGVSRRALGVAACTDMSAGRVFVRASQCHDDDRFDHSHDT